ncbi:MAG: glycosyltransferase [Candidatus Saccharimonadales bacterium]
MYALATAYLLFALARTVYQLTTGFLYVAPTKKRLRRGYHPLVTVIIPAWNEEVGILKTVKSILENGYENLEIIVIDDGSTDNTPRQIQRYKQSVDPRGKTIRFIGQKNAGKSTALNSGIDHARGELIITIDADSYLMPGSVHELVKTMANPNYAVAIGEIVVGNTKNLIGQIQHYEYLVCFHFKRAQHMFNSVYIFPGALTAFRASTLKAVGAFENYSSTEDLDISMRIKAQGHQVAYVDRAVCITEGATNLKSLLNQRIRWRHGFIDCTVKRREFVWSTQKGKYLSFIDFPLSIIGLLEVFIYPLIVLFLIQQMIFYLFAPTLALSYLLVVFILLLLSGLRNDAKIPPAKALLMPFALSIIAILEYIALLIALYRTVRRQKTTWTVWRRSGAR